MQHALRSPWRVAALIGCLVVDLAPPFAGGERAEAAHRAHRPKKAPAPSHAALKTQLSTANQKVKETKSKLVGVKENIRNVKDDLQVKKQRVARLSDQVRELEAKQVQAGKRLTGAKRRLAVAERRVEEVAHRLRKAEERLAAHHRRLSVRIRRNYTAGTVTFADVLLQATSLADFLDRQYYVERIFSSDLQFLNELRDEQRTVALMRAEAERKRDEQRVARVEMELQLQEVHAATNARKDLLQRVQNQKELAEEELRELQQDSQSIASMLESEWRRRQAIWRQLYHGSVPMPRWVGQWMRPVPFPISSGFGLRYHPILHFMRMHTGIDFAAPVGTPIRAAADGEVIWASWRGGYGRCIILLHPGGVATLYGHCSDIRVHYLQKVHRGDLIGASGNSGLSTGPHLHFEIRVNGLPVNPIAQ